MHISITDAFGVVQYAEKDYGEANSVAYETLGNLRTVLSVNGLKVIIVVLARHHHALVYTIPP